MADSKITDLTELATADVAQDDLVEVVDTSASANKKAKVSSIIAPSSASKSASFTFSAAEANRTTVVDSASAVVATIPTNASVAYPLGTKLRAFRKGAGTVKITPDSGVTLRLPTGIVPCRSMGVAVKKTADQTAANYTGGVSISWDGEEFDTHAFHDTSTNNDRLTIPSGLGIKKVSLSANVLVNNMTASNWHVLLFNKNASGSFDGYSENNKTSPNTTHGTALAVVGVPCTDGDYFNAIYRNQSDTAIDVVAASSNFRLMVDEIDAQGWVAYQYGAVEIEKIGTDEWVVTDHSALG